MPLDYSDAPLPQPIELVPEGTIATVSTHIRAGGGGDGDGECEGLNLEFAVLDGPHKGRKFLTVVSTEQPAQARGDNQ